MPVQISEKPVAKQAATAKTASGLVKTIDSVWGILTLVIYLGISFYSGAWYITWLLFPIMALLQKLIHAIGELKGAK